MSISFNFNNKRFNTSRNTKSFTSFDFFNKQINSNNLVNTNNTSKKFQISKSQKKYEIKSNKREKLRILFIEKYTKKYNAIENIDIVEKHVEELISREKILASDIKKFENELKSNLEEIKKRMTKTESNFKSPKNNGFLLRNSNNLNKFLQNFKNTNTEKINEKLFNTKDLYSNANVVNKKEKSSTAKLFENDKSSVKRDKLRLLSLDNASCLNNFNFESNLNEDVIKQNGYKNFDDKIIKNNTSKNHNSNSLQENFRLSSNRFKNNQDNELSNLIYSLIQFKIQRKRI